MEEFYTRQSSLLRPLPQYSCFRRTIVICAVIISASNCFSQGSWIQKANLPASARYLPAGFSIGTKGYFGTGYGGGGTNDFWEWDQASNTWTQKANYAGSPVGYVVGFSIGTKGYIATGLSGSSPFYLQELWEWDQGSNTWTQKTNLGGQGRLGAVAFSIGTKGYIGTGFNATTIPGDFDDFWEWDQTNNTWTQKANFGGGIREYATGFSIGNKGYIGTGHTGGVDFNDFWEYDPATNAWSQKANFGGTARSGAVGFTICSKGYIAVGASGIGPSYSPYHLDIWQYDPASNSWVQKANFPGQIRWGAAAFSINCRGYVGTGYPDINDFWEFISDDSSCCSVTLGIVISSQNIFCNGQCTGTATAVPFSGISPYSYTWSNGQTTQTLTGLCAGSYSVTITDAASATVLASVTITQPTSITTTVSSSSTSCGNNNGTAAVAANGGVMPYTYSWSPSGLTTSSVTGLGAGSYSVMITDANGCTQTGTVSVTASGSFSLNIISTPAKCNTNNGTATVSIIGGTSPFSYNWSNGQTASSISNIAAGNYSVMVTDSYGCTSSTSVTIPYTGNPTANISPDVTITPGQSATLTANGGNSYLWSNGVTDNLVVVSPNTTTIYCVTVTDTNNCSDTACVTVMVSLEHIECAQAESPNAFILPNAFSPNEDGQNERFHLLYGSLLNTCVKEIYIAIYNRWGEKVFESEKLDFSWDGTWRDKPENTAVFAYYLKAVLTNGAEIKKKGNISLSR